MKPPVFEVRRPTTTEEAIDVLAEAGDEAKVLAGGQSLVPLMSFRLARPAVLVDLNAVTELQSIDSTEKGLVIGAMTRQRALERSELAAAGWPLLADVMPYVAHEPIRNRGTVGGSLAHGDAGAELCAASLALDADLVARSRRGQRTIPASDFFLGPFMTELAEDELLVEIVFRALPARTGCGFTEVARRRGDFAMVGAAAVIGLAADDTVEWARLSYLSMAAQPTRAFLAEASLVGQPAGDDAFAAAGEAAAEELEPPDDLHASPDLRRHLARVLTRRALATAYARVIEQS